MDTITIVQDITHSIIVMQGVSRWMEETGKITSEWWDPDNMNAEYLLQHAEPDEFFVALVNGVPAASAILQETERNQSWKYIDGENPRNALYVHWLCVARNFSGQGLPNRMTEFAYAEAKKRELPLLRLDTDAGEKKLCAVYERLGFQRMGTEQTDAHSTAYYQKMVT